MNELHVLFDFRIFEFESNRLLIGVRIMVYSADLDQMQNYIFALYDDQWG